MNKEILLVDDSELIRKMVGDLLRKNNYGVDVASNGRECLVKVSKKVYDLAVIDYVMPEMNGLEALREIINKRYSLPVIILTGEGSVDVAVEAMKLGAIDYVIKAGDYFGLLLQSVEKALDTYGVSETKQELEKEKKEAIDIYKDREQLKVRDRILVVDDSQIEIEKIKNVLTSKYYDIDAAFNGRGCINKILKDTYDLAIIDYVLPDMNGLEILKKVADRNCDVPIIMLTGKGSEEVAVEAMRLGALDYIVKTPDYLKTLIKRMQDNLAALLINSQYVLYF